MSSTDEILRRVIRGGCCRLCLAPENECVPIFATSAADKEPLSQKILTCVNIKVQQGDRLSARICHACISYLNSWQSFKNRCNAAQKKQKTFVDYLLAKERVKQQQQNNNDATSALPKQQTHPQRTLLESQQRLKNALTQRQQHSSSYANNSSSIDVSFIKEEPEDVASDLDDMDAVDPTQFLAQNDDMTGSNDDEGPPILTSLGLTQINNGSELGNENDTADGNDDSMFGSNRSLSGKSQASCAICHMQFSNRANARRHERNIHGIKIDSQNGNTVALAYLQQQQQQQPQQASLIKDRPAVGLPAVAAAALRLARIRELPAVYDYTKPELYRHLLTEPKLYFIKRHIEFLEQYQNMTCKCCDKTFPTYKFFMAHMRKRYDTLSRNLCFKCLKQFQTKPQFIAHLKKKNCLNLYKVYLADDTISKEPLPATQSRRFGSKEIIANKTYGCKLCNATFRLKSDFRTHVVEAHNDAQKREVVGATSCGYCNMEFEDSSVRRRHFNNVECMVFIVCDTCEEKFDSHSEYIEHVYSTHIPAVVAPQIKTELPDGDEDMKFPLDDGSSASQAKSRTPQNCQVCGKQYNNYYNVLRHMESKHPDQLPSTYRCEKCDIGFPRQTELRDHMLNVHGELVKVRRDFLNCRTCGSMFDNKDAWLDHQISQHAKYACFQCEFESEAKDEFETHLNWHAKSRMVKCTLCEHSFGSESSLVTHMSVVHNTKKEESDTDFDMSGEGIMPIECAVDIQVNGGDDDDCDDDGNEADLDETMEQPNKKIRLNHDQLKTDSPNANADGQLVSTCRMCKKTFATRALMIVHIRQVHNMPGKYPIISSNAIASPTPAPPREVSQVHNVNNRLRCRICQKRIHTKNAYKRHMWEAHQVSDCVFIKCKMCPSEFSNDKGLKVHMFRTHNITVQQMQEDESLIPEPQQESTTSTPLPVKTPQNVIFECDICHIVYRSKEDLKLHKADVHNITDSDVTQQFDTSCNLDDSAVIPQETWWQCRFCNESFNASKKLTIHMNSHEEYDNTETTCKDCGNTYGTRKSLWVHRQKKHPRIPNPSPCALCDKTFFDKTELVHHLKTHSNDDVFSHLQEMQDQLEAEQETRQKQQKMQEGDGQGGVELSCHICHQRFHDKRVLSKHLRIHEQQKQSESLFTSSPLAAMLADTTVTMEGNGASDYDYPTYKGQMVDNQFPCDMCPKTFPLVTALKVHRGWHFRSPDGRQITDSNNIWHPDSVSSGSRKRARLQNPPVCPYCHSTFASGNNLRRHIVEVHKRNEAKMMRENGNAGDNIFIEKECECHACGITFSNRSEWVSHKIAHARTMKPSTTFEWGCEICGKIFTRKERLLVHIVVHSTGVEEDGNPNSNDQTNDYDSNSQSSMSSHSPSQRSQDANQLQAPKSSAHKAGMSLLKQPSLLKQQLIQPQQQKAYAQQQRDEQTSSSTSQRHTSAPSSPKAESTRMEDANSDNDTDDDDDDDDNAEASLSCDLCQVYFSDSDELRRHITSHIMNGPEIVNNESSPQKVDESSVANKSNESIEDGVIEYVEDEELDNGDDEVEGAIIVQGDEELESNDGDLEHLEMEENDEQFDDSDSDDDDDEDDDDDDDDEESDMHRNIAAEKADNTCNICGTDRGSYEAASRCMLKHEETTDVKCSHPNCQLYFENDDTLQRHQSICHPEE